MDLGSVRRPRLKDGLRAAYVFAIVKGGDHCLLHSREGREAEIGDRALKSIWKAKIAEGIGILVTSRERHRGSNGCLLALEGGLLERF